MSLSNACTCVAHLKAPTPEALDMSRTHVHSETAIETPSSAESST